MITGSFFYFPVSVLQLSSHAYCDKFVEWKSPAVQVVHILCKK
jgi:hypothetical protein